MPPTPNRLRAYSTYQAVQLPGSTSFATIAITISAKKSHCLAEEIKGRDDRIREILQNLEE